MGLRSFRVELLQRASDPTEINAKINLNAGFLLALLANIIWGTSFLASKYTLQAWEPFTASSLRFAVATLALLGTLFVTGKKIDVPRSFSQWLILFVIATTGFGLLYPLQLAGLKLVSSSLSAAIMLTSPLIVLILGRMFLKERLSTMKWVAMGIGIAGGSLLLFGRTGSSISAVPSADLLEGIMLTFLASGFLATSVIFTRRASKTLPTASITFWTMAIGFIELTIAAIIFEGTTFKELISHSTLLSWVSLLYLALVCSAFCFYIWNQALSLSSPQEIASSMHIKTPTAVLIGLCIGNEILSFQMIVATTLVMFGVWLSQQTHFRSTK